MNINKDQYVYCFRNGNTRDPYYITAYPFFLKNLNSTLYNKTLQSYFVASVYVS